MTLTEEEQKNRHICEEGIKYLKNYSMQHFAEEEAYMRSIGYKGYEMHKRLHDNMRDKTLPSLERAMEKSDFSAESVGQFVGICLAWLTGHIMVEDRAITGRVASRWDSDQEEEINTLLEHSLIDILRNIFGLDSHTFSDHYSGEQFGKTVNYRFDYLPSQGRRLQLYMLVEEELIFNTIGQVIGIKFCKMDNTLLAATKQMTQQILRSMGAYFQDADDGRLEKDVLLSTDAVQRVFEKRNPKYSILLDTGMGYLAFCVDAP